jgi:tetratricopeptide (TPR) repeat protein
VPMLQPFVSFLDVTLVTFGRWDEVLQQPLPPVEIAHANAMAHYARGVAFAATGKWTDAQKELGVVTQLAAAATADNKPVFDIAMHALMGEIALRRGEMDKAITHFKAAMAIEDGILYFEPPTWYYPIRHSLGVALLRANRAADAELVYGEDLKRFPENGWALFGLSQALQAQGKTAEAAEVNERFQRAWQGADVTLVASRF